MILFCSAIMGLVMLLACGLSWDNGYRAAMEQVKANKIPIHKDKKIKYLTLKQYVKRTKNS